MYLKSVSVFEAVGDDLALGHLVEPVQFTTTVSVVVERREPLKTTLQLETTHRQVLIMFVAVSWNF